MVRAHQSFRAFVAALAGAAIFLPSVLASTDVLARTVYVTPAGGTGFDEKNIAHTPTRAFVTNNFDDLQPGDVLKFLSDSADPQHVAMFEGRISLQDLRAEVAPLVIEGLGERTKSSASTSTIFGLARCRSRTRQGAPTRFSRHGMRYV